MIKSFFFQKLFLGVHIGQFQKHKSKMGKLRKITILHRLGAILTKITGEAAKLFIGGVSFSTEEGTLKQAFEKYGKVLEARIMMDHETSKPRGMCNQQI